MAWDEDEWDVVLESGTALRLARDRRRDTWVVAAPSTDAEGAVAHEQRTIRCNGLVSRVLAARRRHHGGRPRGGMGARSWPGSPRPPTSRPSQTPPAPVSASAQRLYSEARPHLLQVHAPQGAGQPGQRRIGLPRHRRRPHPHQLPRRQRGGAAAGSLPSGLQHRRPPRRRAAAPRLRRHPRPRRRQAGRSGAARRPGALRFRSRDRALEGRAHLLARQPARRRLRRDRGHLQRPRRAQLLPDDLLLRLAQSRRSGRRSTARAR